MLKVRNNGVRIEYRPEANGLVKIKLSLHSFHHGHNLGRFTVPEIRLACANLAAFVGLHEEEMRVVGLEAGVNMGINMRWSD